MPRLSLLQDISKWMSRANINGGQILNCITKLAGRELNDELVAGASERANSQGIPSRLVHLALKQLVCLGLPDSAEQPPLGGSWRSLEERGQD